MRHAARPGRSPGGQRPGPRRYGWDQHRRQASHRAAAPASGYRRTSRHGRSRSAPPGKMKLTLQSDDQFRNGFSGGSWGRSAGPAQPPGNHPFPRASPGQPRRPRLLPSHTFCVGMLDLASVSTSVRSISNSVRRTHPTVSANLRRKLPLIARRAVHHCAPLHVVPATAADRERQIAQLVKDDEIDADEQVGHLAGLAGAALRPRAG